MVEFKKWDLVGSVLNILNDISEIDAREILIEAEKRYKIVAIQFYTPNISENTLRVLNTLVIPVYPNALLNIWLNKEGLFSDINFFYHLSNLKALCIRVDDKISLEKINDFLELNEVRILGKHFSIDFLKKQKNIQTLFIAEKVDEFKKVGELATLTKITIASIAVRNLIPIVKLKKLQELNFLLGSLKTLSGIEDLQNIKKISFCRVRNLTSELLNELNVLQNLELIEMDTQSSVTDLSWLKIKGVNIEIKNCKNFIHGKNWKGIS